MKIAELARSIMTNVKGTWSVTSNHDAHASAKCEETGFEIVFYSADMGGHYTTKTNKGKVEVYYSCPNDPQDGTHRALRYASHKFRMDTEYGAGVKRIKLSITRKPATLAKAVQTKVVDFYMPYHLDVMERDKANLAVEDVQSQMVDRLIAAGVYIQRCGDTRDGVIAYGKCGPLSVEVLKWHKGVVRVRSNNNITEAEAIAIHEATK